MANINDERFTEQEYNDYLNSPQWARDGFDSEDAYETSWCNRIREWQRESEDATRSIRDVWKNCYKGMYQPIMRSATSSPTYEDNIAAYRLAIMKNECLEEVAALYANDYIPTLQSLGDQVKPLCALGNMYLQQEFKLNGWQALKFTLGVDAFITRQWIVQVNTDDDQKGPFGQPKKITINRIDPRNFFPDIKATRLDWNAMDYIIVTEETDMGVARAKFKEKAAKIVENLTEPGKPFTQRYSNSQLVVMPGMKGINETVTDRNRLHLKMCWLHDERYEFKAETYEDESGDEKTRVDSEGFVVGSFQKAYPYGRLIVTAADKVILLDIGNPFWHREAPFVVCSQEPDMGDIIGVGKAAEMLGIERRVNDVESRVHSYAQSEIERPMQADVGALVTNSAYYKTTGMSRAIMLKNPGKNFVRPPAIETPQFIVPYLQRLMGYKDMIIGKNPMMQGQIPPNLSGEAVQSTQAYGQSRWGMQSVFISESLRKLGYQVFETIRQTYPENIGATIMLPDGSEVHTDWDSDALDGAYFMSIDIAANQPGGKQAMQQNLITLYDKGLTDDIYTLQNLGVEGWQDIIKRKRSMKQQQIYDQAAGRAAGLELKEIIKQNERPGAPEGNKKLGVA